MNMCRPRCEVTHVLEGSHSTLTCTSEANPQVHPRIMHGTLALVTACTAGGDVQLAPGGGGDGGGGRGAGEYPHPQDHQQHCRWSWWCLGSKSAVAVMLPGCRSVPGLYYCHVNNSMGADSCHLELTGEHPPDPAPSPCHRPTLNDE